MARVELAPEVAADLDRILAHLDEHEAADPASRIRDIIAAFDVLERNPLIGRPARGGNRELVIGHGGKGYVALYRYLAGAGMVLVLAIRNQREAGYSDS